MIGSDIVDWQPSIGGTGEDRFMVPIHIEQDEEPIGSRTAKAATTEYLNCGYLPNYSDVENDVRGAKLISTNYGAFPQIDGITINEGDVILVKNIHPRYSGMYELTDAGDVFEYWQLTRTEDMDELSDFQNGTKVFIEEGNLYGSESFIMKIHFVGDPKDIGNITDNGSVFFHKIGTITPYLVKAGNLPDSFPKNVDLNSSEDILITSDVNSIEHINQIVAEINRRIFLDNMTAEDRNDFAVGIYREASMMGYLPAFESDIYANYSDVQDYKRKYVVSYPSDGIFGEVREALENCYVLPERDLAISLFYKEYYNIFHDIKDNIDGIRNDETLGLGDSFGISTERLNSEFFNMNQPFCPLYFEPSTDVETDNAPINIHNTINSYREKLSIHNYYCMQGSNKYTVYQRYENTGSGWSKTDEDFAENNTDKNAMLYAPEIRDSRVVGIGTRSYYIASDGIQVAYYARGVWSTKIRTDLLPDSDNIRKVILLVRFATSRDGSTAEEAYYNLNGIDYETGEGIIDTLNTEFENWFYWSGHEGYGPWYLDWSELPKLEGYTGGPPEPTVKVYLCNADFNTASFDAWPHNDDDTYLGVLNIGGSFGWIEIPVSDFVSNLSLDHLSILFVEEEELNINRTSPPFSFGAEFWERVSPIRACCIHIYKE